MAEPRVFYTVGDRNPNEELPARVADEEITDRMSDEDDEEFDEDAEDLDEEEEDAEESDR